MPAALARGDLHSPTHLPIVPRMCTRAHPSPFRRLCLLFLLSAAGACGSRTATDPGNREVAWTYGPTTGGATAEHVQGTGGKGGAAIARGWQCRLQDGKRLTIVPYQLASSHPLFGKVRMSVGLFDKTGKQIASIDSGVITAQNAAFTFELSDDVARQLWDLVIWYCTV